MDIKRRRKQQGFAAKVSCYNSCHFSPFSDSVCTPVTFASIVADLELDSSWPTGGSSGWGSSPRSCHRAVPSRAVTWVGPLACLIPVNNPGSNHVSGRQTEKTDEKDRVPSGRGFTHDCTRLIKNTAAHTYAHPLKCIYCKLVHHYSMGDHTSVHLRAKFRLFIMHNILCLDADANIQRCDDVTNDPRSTTIAWQ